MIKVDANKLPENIKAQAKNYCNNELEHSYADTREELEEDVMRAWLKGFAFCLEGTVEVKVKQCATCIYTDSPCLPSDYAKTAKGECDHYKSVLEGYEILKKRAGDLVYCVEHCAKNELAVARCVERLKKCL
jgi:hypothetical protein